MTAGALLQLKYGLDDRMAFLTFNPSISHFKSVYKRYTNFSMETISVLPNRNNILSFDTDTSISFKIGRDGDLIKDMFLTFEFPDIYSSSNTTDSMTQGCGGNHSFQWIKRLAEYLVKEITITMDTQTMIDHHYSEWFHIHSEMTLPFEKKNGYYDMIGNITEYYDPANSAGCNGNYPSGYTNGNPSTPYAPSIVGRRIILPLQFWFNQNAVNSFPLIATQHMEFWVNVTLRKLKELYTIINSNDDRIQPPSNLVFGKFHYPQTNTNILDLNVNLEVNYIFLEREERKRFALASHEYLITQLQRITYSSSSNNISTINIDMRNFSKPVTNLFFIIRRTDFESCNQWSNFTNWISDIPPYRSGFINPFGSNPTLSQFPAKIEYYKTPYMLRGSRILINGSDLVNGRIYNFDNGGTDINGKDSFYYNYIQPYMFQKNIPSQGIYSYSFSLDNNEFQPNGAINMSSISTKELILSLINMDQIGYNEQSYNINVYVFALNYEITRILGGMFGTASSN